MKRAIAFDHTETITRHPNVCREMIKSLASDGWSVYVLSGDPMDSIKRGVAAAGILEEWLADIISRTDKGAACEELQIDVLVDDDVNYISQCTSRVLRLHVRGIECCVDKKRTGE